MTHVPYTVKSAPPLSPPWDRVVLVLIVLVMMVIGGLLLVIWAPPASAQAINIPVEVPAPQARSFIVIQIQHASPLLIAYAVQADDVIWEDTGAGGGSGYGSRGRGQSTTGGGQSHSSGRGGSSYSGRGGSGGRSR